MEKYEWTGTISAPQEYPVEVYSGAITANDFTYSFDAIWGTQNAGWGSSSKTMSVSTKKMEIPHTLEFTWYSLVENKFYSGKWPLDNQKIESLFKDGVVNRLNGKKGAYTEFKIGLAPKGKVVLWVDGEGYQKEVGVFQAQDTIIKKEDAYEGAQYMFDKDFAEGIVNDSDFETFKPDVKVRIAKYGYPNPQVYDVFRDKYPWNTIINLPEGCKLENAGVYLLCNGEWDDFNNKKEKAIPYYITFSFIGGDGKKYGADIIFTQDKEYRTNYLLKGNDALPTDFDLNEINDLFHKKLNAKENIDLIIDVTLQNNEISINLKQNNNIFPLKNNIRKLW